MLSEAAACSSAVCAQRLLSIVFYSVLVPPTPPQVLLLADRAAGGSVSMTAAPAEIRWSCTAGTPAWLCCSLWSGGCTLQQTPSIPSSSCGACGSVMPAAPHNRCHALLLYARQKEARQIWIMGAQCVLSNKPHACKACSNEKASTQICICCTLQTPSVWMTDHDALLI